MQHTRSLGNLQQNSNGGMLLSNYGVDTVSVIKLVKTKQILNVIRKEKMVIQQLIVTKLQW